LLQLVVELGAVLHGLLAVVTFVTEATLHDEYRELKSELDAIGMTLHELVEVKLAGSLVAVRDAEMPGFLRQDFFNQLAGTLIQQGRWGSG
ncbi:hypothetical protein AAVH_23379, partial [Aphelenchoides avenae]